MGVVANRLSISLLRALAFATTLASAILVSTCHERDYVFGVKLEAKFSDTPAFKYFVIVNIIASAYTVAVLFLPLAGSLAELVLALDVVFTMLLMSGIGAALAISQVGYQYVTNCQDTAIMWK